MIDYDAMSDFEINKSVATELNVRWCIVPCGLTFDEWVFSDSNDDDDSDFIALPNYCNNWSDIGPIIEECMICLEPKINISMWAAYANADKKMIFDISDKSETIDANPKRAAAICFLKMMEDKK